MGSSGSGDNEVKETAEEIELAKITKEGWGRYETKLADFEDDWIASIRMDQGDHDLITGQVNAGVGSEADMVTDQVIGTQIQQGINPSSGRMINKVAGAGLDRAKATGAATSKASQAVDDQTLQGLQQAVSLGRGEAVESTRDMTSLAYDATSKAINDTLNKNNTSQSVTSSAMTAAGMGLAGWKNGARNMSSPHYQPEQGDMMTLDKQPLYGR